MEAILIRLALVLIFAAAALLVLDLILRARREWHKDQIRRAFQAKVQRELARDTLVHDRIHPVFDPEATSQGPWQHFALPVVEEADDYLDIMAMREAWQSRGFDPAGLVDNRQWQ